MHVGDGEVRVTHLFGKPLNSALFVAEDDCLGYRKGVVEVTQCFEFVVVFLDGNEELLNTV